MLLALHNNILTAAFTGLEVVNTGASLDTGNRFNVCQRTGFRVKAGGLMKEQYGAWVRPESYERPNPLDLGVRVKAESLTGALRPEPSTDLTYSSIAPEDL